MMWPVRTILRRCRRHSTLTICYTIQMGMNISFFGAEFRERHSRKVERTNDMYREHCSGFAFHSDDGIFLLGISNSSCAFKCARIRPYLTPGCRRMRSAKKLMCHMIRRWFCFKEFPAPCVLSSPAHSEVRLYHTELSGCVAKLSTWPY